jgi:hypothetical protein
VDSLFQKLLTSTEQEVGGARLALGGNILHVGKNLPLLVRDRYLVISAVNLLIELSLLSGILSLLTFLFVRGLSNFFCRWIASI